MYKKVYIIKGIMKTTAKDRKTNIELGNCGYKLRISLINDYEHEFAVAVY